MKKDYKITKKDLDNVAKLANDMYKMGLKDGKKTGYDTGLLSGLKEGYKEGYEGGYKKGFDDTYEWLNRKII